MRSVFLNFLFIILLGCSTSKVTNEISLQQLEKYVNDKSFQISADWAYPQVTNAMNQLGNAGLFPPGSNSAMINLQGNNNYLKFYPDKVAAYLPFFGERQMGGGYNNANNGIAFDDIPKNLIIEKHKKNSYILTFRINDKNSLTENYNVRIELFPSLYSTITVNSSHRFLIRYKGKVSNIEDKVAL